MTTKMAAAYHVSGLELHDYLRTILTPEEYQRLMDSMERFREPGQGNLDRADT